jgi:hypothetical protein
MQPYAGQGQQDQQRPPRPLSSAPVMDVPPPPDDIPVPTPQLYHAIQNGDFYEYLDPYYHEGWKLHLPLPDSGYFYPHGKVIFWRGERRQTVSALRYFTSPAGERQHDHVEQDLRITGYRDLFIYLQKKKVPHKFVPKVSLLRQMEQLPGQEGKFLTIYPTGHGEMLKVISKAEQFLGLMNFHGCFNASKHHTTVEKRVPALGIITARYGSFVDAFVLKPADLMPAKIGDPADLQWALKDDRTKYKPDHIRDPWDGQPPGGEWGWREHPGYKHG